MLYNYAHGSTLFTGGPSLPRPLDPKASWLFQIRFELNNNVSRFGRFKSELELLEAGMMATQVQLPKFTVENKVFNAYNRVNLVQSKIKYDPVTITFHDDHSNVVLSLWKDYFSYYYRDGDYGVGGGQDSLHSGYSYEHKYVDRQEREWGYTLRNEVKQESQYINAIRIYSLSQGKFSEYILVNPMITQFQHGEHNVSEGTTLMKHTMTVNYETVLYYDGDVTENTISGIGKPPHYAPYGSYLKEADANTVVGNNVTATQRSDNVKSDTSDPNGKFSNSVNQRFSIGNTKNASLQSLQRSEVNGMLEKSQLIKSAGGNSRGFNIPYINPSPQNTGVNSNNSNMAGSSSTNWRNQPASGTGQVWRDRDGNPIKSGDGSYVRSGTPPNNAVSSNGSDIAKRGSIDRTESTQAAPPLDNLDGSTSSQTYKVYDLTALRPINNPPETE